jgi:hypothetical protein
MHICVDIYMRMCINVFVIFLYIHINGLDYASRNYDQSNFTKQEGN